MAILDELTFPRVEDVNVDKEVYCFKGNLLAKQRLPNRTFCDEPPDR